jgi:hypothetical protein
LAGWRSPSDLVLFAFQTVFERLRKYSNFSKTHNNSKRIETPSCSVLCCQFRKKSNTFINVWLDIIETLVSSTGIILVDCCVLFAFQNSISCNFCVDFTQPLSRRDWLFVDFVSGLLYHRKSGPVNALLHEKINVSSRQGRKFIGNQGLASIVYGKGLSKKRY